MRVRVEDITIRNNFKPGDIGRIIQMHGLIYSQEYNFGIEFEKYVTQGLLEFINNYDNDYDRIWICEYNREIIGSLVLMHRSNNEAQLRYFLIMPEFRGIGLGKLLINSFLNFLIEKNYQRSFLWTTDQLSTAISLYTRIGYKFTKEKKTNHFGKSVRELRYDLILS